MDPAGSLADNMARTFSNCLNKKLQTELKEKWNLMDMMNSYSTERSKHEAHNKDTNCSLCALQREHVVLGWSSGQNMKTWGEVVKRMMQLGCGHANKWLRWSGDGGHWSSIVLRCVRPQCESDDDRERERMRLWTSWPSQWPGGEGIPENSPCQRKKRERDEVI